MNKALENWVREWRVISMQTYPCFKITCRKGIFDCVGYGHTREEAIMNVSIHLLGVYKSTHVINPDNLRLVPRRVPLLTSN